MWWRQLGGVQGREILRLPCIVSAITIAYPSVRPELQISKIIALSEFSRKENADLHAFENKQARIIYSWLEDYPSDPPKRDFSRREDSPDLPSKQTVLYLTS